MAKISDYCDIWGRKPALKIVYNDFYTRIAECCIGGRTLEIGSGIGNLRQRFPDIVSSDIQYAPWLDIVLDAQNIPFKDGSFENIVMVDVLHHIEHTLNFFNEANRILHVGGRIVVVEPAITPFSWFFYNFFHEEPVLLRDNPLTYGQANPERDPYCSNQAIPTLIVTSHKNIFSECQVGFEIKKVIWFSPLSYPLTGGFKSWSLITENGASNLISLEKKIEHIVGKFLGFRLLTVYEKIHDRIER